MENNIIFSETKLFRKWWITIPLLAVLLFTFYCIKKQIIDGEIIGNNPPSDLAVILLPFIPLSLLLFLFMNKLTMVIQKNGLIINFKPYFEKFVKWQDINNVEILKPTFPAYGIRFGTKHGVVYNLGARYGLLIHKNNGDKFMVGVKNVEHLKASLSNIGVPYRSHT